MDRWTGVRQALIEVLLLGRHLKHEHLVAGLAPALRAGALTTDAVALEARPAGLRKHIELVVDPETGAETSVRLGVRLSNVRSGWDGLTPERAEALNELGLRWT